MFLSHGDDNLKTMFNRFAAAGLVLAAVAPVHAFAQSATDWQFQASVYAYLPTISGKSIFPPQSGGSSASVDIDAILEDLKFAFMGSFEARRGQWGAFTDVIYMDIGDTNEQSRSLSLGRVAIPAGVNAKTTYDLKGWVWTLAGTYRAIASREATLDVLAGARMLDVRPKVNWELTGNVGPIALPDRSGNREAKLQNWDAIVGVKGRVGLGQEGKWFVPYYLDVGTGESDFTWQAMGGVGYTFGWGDVVAAWRYTDYEMKSGDAVEELNFNGPAIAAVFRW